MSFQEKRRQQFLGEAYYNETSTSLPDSINYFSNHPFGSGSNIHEKQALARGSSADDTLNLLTLRYTAGVDIYSLQSGIESVVVAYEAYGSYLWKYHNDLAEPVFDFSSIDGYSLLMQVTGLCFLLNRRDLFRRIARLQDGPREENGGTDTLYEEFMSHALSPEERFQCDYLCCSRPYKSLFNALTEQTLDARLEYLNTYLKRWYKDLAGCAWHDSHKAEGGYYGYWSFEAGAAVILLGIEDDSCLHKYLYYPKDLVAWCRANADTYSNTPEPLVEPTSISGIAAGQPCPRSGWWFTPALLNSRRYFQQGIPFPAISESDYGNTVWQWSPDQSNPLL